MSISGIGSSPYAQPYQPPSFSSLDTNNDGSISLDELEAAAPGGASATSNANVQALFKAMDTNGDGSVSQSEMSSFNQKVQSHHHGGGGHHHGGMGFLAQQLSQTSDSQAFAATDTNGDGSVSLSELSADPAAQGVGSTDMQQLFNMIDANGDGSISPSESSSFLDQVRQAVGQAGGSSQSSGVGGFSFGGPDATGSSDATDPLSMLLQTGSSSTTGASNDNSSSTSDGSSSSSTSSPSDLLLMAANAYSGSAQQTDLVGMLQTLLQTAA